MSPGQDTQRGFTDEERAAMRERVRAAKAEARRGRGRKADGEGDLLAKIGEMQESDRAMATRIHETVNARAPGGEGEILELRCRSATWS
jgi:predicted phage gp36 major capsid-like protein